MSHPVQWPSPLKSQSSKSYTHSSGSQSTSRRKLFDDQAESDSTISELPEIKESKAEVKRWDGQLDFEALTHIYGLNFDKAPCHQNQTEFYATSELVLEIERLCQRQNIPTDPVRNRIKDGLKVKDFQKKIAEFGLILFYLDRDKTLPDTPSLLAYRASEVSKEIDGYLMEHAENCDDGCIPTGKTHYLMRVFAHMCFTSTKFYNKGGLTAVLELLQTDYGISKYLHAEHRNHILIVAKQILGSTAIEELFKQDFKVDVLLQDAIRFDLKLGPKTTIHPVHVLYDCMMAMFIDVRQMGTSNCYAVASLIYAMENHTYKVIATLFKWLRKGTFSFNDSFEIPILPLLEKRLKSGTDLEQNLANDKAQSLVPLKHISETLHLKPKGSEKKTMPLGETLFYMLKANNEENLTDYATKLFYAYKTNALIHLQLAVCEFVMMNANPTASPIDPFSDYKTQLVTCCLECIEKNLPPQKIDPNFHELLKSKLNKCLWFENCIENDVQKKSKNCITVGDSETITAFKGDQDQLVDLFKDSLRVSYLNGGEYTVLRKVTDLQDKIFILINEIKYDNKKRWEKEADAYRKALENKEFKSEICKEIVKQITKNSAQNKVNGIHHTDLLYANLLIFKQIGGFPQTVLGLVYDITVQQETISDCSTPFNFLKHLVVKLSMMDRRDSLAMKSSPKILITGGKHAWTLSPFCWNLLPTNFNSFKTFMTEVFFNPGEKKIDSLIESDTLDAILDKCIAINSTNYEHLRKHFSQQKNLTYGQFRDSLLKNSKPWDKEKLTSIIDLEFSKTTLSKNDIGKVMEKLKITVPENSAIFCDLSMDPEMPYHFASHIYNLLIEEGIAILDPFEIERAICSVKQIPITIDVGDTNWTDTASEDPYHVHLVIAYSWTKGSKNGTPCFFWRTSNTQELVKANNFSEFKIEYPLYLRNNNNNHNGNITNF